MVLNLVYIALGLLGLYFGGNGLVLGASRLASALGIPPLVVGLTIVSLGTSMPELMVSLSAALGGSSDISIGNVIGSNIANIGLILALSGLIIVIPIHFDLIKREIPIVIGASFVMLLLALDGQIGTLDGLLLVAGLVSFTALLVVASLRERITRREAAELLESEQAEPPYNRLLEIGRMIGGLLVLLLGANLMVDGSVAIARELQVSELIIGVTVVAVGTSLPELSASVIAALKRQDDILFGNVVGSNIFNILGILGITALVRPIGVQPELLRLELPVMVGFTLPLIVFALRGRLPRWASALMLAAYLGFVVVVVAQG
jgi:cation:H+ antiporter